MNDLSQPAQGRWWSRPPPSFLPPLPVAVAVVIALGYTGDLLYGVFSGTAGTDLSEYVAAARMGMTQGWAAPYNHVRFASELRAMGLPPDAYLNTPITSWLVAPLAGLPVHVAYVIWLALLAAILVWTWRVAAPGAGGVRRWHLMTALGVFPVYFALWLGQITLIVVGLVVLHWWLLGRGRPVLAGVALGLAFLKPQMVALVPVALLLSGRWKAAAGCFTTVAVLALVTVVVLGTDGLAGYRSSVQSELAVAFTTRHTLSEQLPTWMPRVSLGAVAAAAVLPALLDGTRRYERALASAVLGSLLVTPYLNPQDLAILVPCGWLLLRTEGRSWMEVPMMATYAVLALDPGAYVPGGAVIVVAVEVAWLAVFVSQALQPAILVSPPARELRADWAAPRQE